MAEREEGPASAFGPESFPESSERLERVEELLTDENENSEFPTAVVRVFGIKCPVMETYLAVLDNPRSTSRELATIRDYDRNGLNRHLRTLREKGLVTRKRAFDREPGNTYKYTAKPLDEATEWMKSELEAWSETVTDELAQLREEYQENSEASDSA